MFHPVQLTELKHYSGPPLVKNGQWVFSGSRHPESFRPNPQTRVAPINAQRHPCLRVWSETHSITLIEISFLKKASFSLQNSALIAILIVKGREVVFWKACGGLCHGGGSEKTRNRKSTGKKVKKNSGFWIFQPSLVFQAKP